MGEQHKLADEPKCKQDGQDETSKLFKNVPRESRSSGEKGHSDEVQYSVSTNLVTEQNNSSNLAYCFSPSDSDKKMN